MSGVIVVVDTDELAEFDDPALEFGVSLAMWEENTGSHAARKEAIADRVIEAQYLASRKEAENGSERN